MTAHSDSIWLVLILLGLTAGLAGALWTATRAVTPAAVVRTRRTR
jgi:hypothetical protein